MLVQQAGRRGAGRPPSPGAAWPRNLLPVIAGNLLGGSVLVGLTYHVIYRGADEPARRAAPPD